MIKQDFIDAFTLRLSGAGEMKNEKEMWWFDEKRRDLDGDEKNNS